MTPTRLAAVLLTLTLGTPAVACAAPVAGAERDQAPAAADRSGFARAEHVRPFHFPADYGPHPRFRTEWWYFTGNLRDAAQRRFGYELTLFRIALLPRPARRASRWATRQIYMGHFTVTDAAAGRFHYFQRLERGGALGLAGAQADPFRVWVDDWSVTGGPGAAFPWRLQAAQGKVRLRLELTPLRPVVLQGDHGLSRKSSAPGNASYYYSYPRMRTRGALSVDGQTYDVTGLSWMDREWSTSALGADQVGWDWFGLHLSDGRDLMYYQLRRTDGSVDPHSMGTLVDAAGGVRHLTRDDVTLKVLGHWRSPDGAVYPSGWRMSVPSAHLQLTIRPLIRDQELRVSVRYWEGAVRIRGTRDGSPVHGEGYAELTGYAPASGAAPRAAR